MCAAAQNQQPLGQGVGRQGAQQALGQWSEGGLPPRSRPPAVTLACSPASHCTLHILLHSLLTAPQDRKNRDVHLTDEDTAIPIVPRSSYPTASPTLPQTPSLPLVSWDPIPG